MNTRTCRSEVALKVFVWLTSSKIVPGSHKKSSLRPPTPCSRDVMSAGVATRPWTGPGSHKKLPGPDLVRLTRRYAIENTGKVTSTVPIRHKITLFGIFYRIWHTARLDSARRIGAHAWGQVRNRECSSSFAHARMQHTPSVFQQGFSQRSFVTFSTSKSRVLKVVLVASSN